MVMLGTVPSTSVQNYTLDVVHRFFAGKANTQAEHRNNNVSQFPSFSTSVTKYLRITVFLIEKSS